jgi:flagellin-like protein
MEIEKDSIKKLQKARKGKGRRAVSPVIATLLLIAIAVAAGIVLYIFVSGLTTSLSNVKGTVTEPLQVTVTNSGSSCTGTSCTINLLVVNPNGASVTLTNYLITNDAGAAIANGIISTTVSAHNTASVSIITSSLTSGESYRLTVLGTDSAGNQYSSNPAVFTAG